MPRIRKKTSKRGTTHQRHKIKHKAAESKRKQKKEAKKNPQWKSKHTKDPGIPNNFPYKDQILAEIAEQRRQVEEAKQRRKEEKKAAKAGAAEDAPEASENEAEGEEEQAFDGFAIPNAKLIKAGKGKAKELAEEEEAPMLMNTELGSLKEVLDKADVLVEVLDARDPLVGRSAFLEGLAKEAGKKVVLVLNKIDTVPRETLNSWLVYLRAEHPTFLFRSASAMLPNTVPSSVLKGKAKAPADDGVGAEVILSCLGQWAKEKEGEKPFRAAVVGVANSGKSSFVNSLLRKSILPIYQLPSLSTRLTSPTTTSYAQEVSFEIEGKTIAVVDTPGLSWISEKEREDESVDEERVKDVLVRNRGRLEKLKDPVPFVEHIVKRAKHEDLMFLYNLPAFMKGDVNAFLTGVARRAGFVKKGGDLDLTNAARSVLRDWNTGKLARYVSPPASSASASSNPSSEAGLKHLYEKDGEVLKSGAVKSRKEMVLGSGLVKMRAAEIEGREVALEERWVSEAESGSEEEDEEQAEGEVGGEGDALDAEDDGGEEDQDEGDDHEDGEETSSPAPIGKRKRQTGKVSAPPPRPVKKVTFGALPKESKQVRRAASSGKGKKGKGGRR